MDRIKQLRRKLINSRLGQWLQRRYQVFGDWVCEEEGHIFLIRLDKPYSKMYFNHILHCGRCWKVFGNRKVRVQDYDSPGYETSIRIWMATLKSVPLDSKTIRKLAGNLLKLRFRMQQEPSMYDKIKKANKQKDEVPNLIETPNAAQVAHIVGKQREG